jgi:hypothetical protein
MWMIRSSAVFADPIAWWKRGTKLFTNIAGTTAASSAGDPIRNWTDDVGGYVVTQSGTGPLFPPELHTDTEAVRFDRDPNLLAGAAGLAGLLDGDDTPFSAILRFRTAAALGLTHTPWGLHDTGAAGAVAGHSIRSNATPAWQTIRRGDSLDVVSVAHGTPATSTEYTRTHVFHGTTYSEWLDGTLIQDAVAMNVSAATFTNLIIGAADTAGAGSFDGLIWDLMFFDHEIGAATRQHWEGVVSV